MRLTKKIKQGSFDQLDHNDLQRELWRINWKQHGYPFCGVYAIAPDNGWPTKVGISQNPVKRLIGLQSACWRRLDVAQYRYAPSFAEARAVEVKVHEMLTGDGKLMMGEWFDVRPEQAVEVIEFAAQVQGVDLRADIPDARVEKALRSWGHKARIGIEVARDEDFHKSMGVDASMAHRA